MRCCVVKLKAHDAYFKRIIILWKKTTHYPNKIRIHLVIIVPMAPFTPKATSKLRSHSALWKFDSHLMLYSLSLILSVSNNFRLNLNNPYNHGFSNFFIHD